MAAGDFIVLFKDDISKEVVDEEIRKLQAAGGIVKKRWDSGILNGFSATIPSAFLDTFKSLAGDKIESIEPDSIVTIQ